MSIFNENIKGIPRVTAQSIREFQDSITINREDPIDMICDKLCTYIYYWVHVHLLDYKSLTIDTYKIAEVPWDYDANGNRAYNPRIDKFIENITGRGFEVSIDSLSNTIKIKW